MEDRALVFQLAAQLHGIGQVAVVAQRHGAAAMTDDHGLGVGADAGARSGVAHMTGSHVCRGSGQTCQHLRGEHLVYKAQIPVAGDHAVIVDGNTAALLPAVLQRIQG